MNGLTRNQLSLNNYYNLTFKSKGLNFSLGREDPIELNINIYIYILDDLFIFYYNVLLG